MFLFYFSVILAIWSSALYHFTAKSPPSNVNYTVSLLVTVYSTMRSPLPVEPPANEQQSLF